MPIATRTAGSLAVALIVAFLAAASTAHAHARLTSAYPPKGSTVAAVSEIRLVFNERVEPSLSIVELHSAAGNLLATSRGQPICVDKTCVLALEPPGPGSFNVKYRVLSEDGHVVEGS